MKKYYIIATRRPIGATSEEQITHYKVSVNLEDAEKGIGQIFEKKDFIDFLEREGAEAYGYNPTTKNIWKVGVAKNEKA